MDFDLNLVKALSSSLANTLPVFVVVKSDAEAVKSCLSSTLVVATSKRGAAMWLAAGKEIGNIVCLHELDPLSAWKMSHVADLWCVHPTIIAVQVKP